MLWINPIRPISAISHMRDIGRVLFIRYTLHGRAYSGGKVDVRRSEADNG